MEEKRQLPERLRLKDFAGSLFTLNTNTSAWRELSLHEDVNKDILLLGISAGKLEELSFVRKALEAHNNIFWLEAPDTLEQLKKNNIPLPPVKGPWTQLEAEDLYRQAFTGRIFFYEPGRRLAPDFWGPILGSLMLAKDLKTPLHNPSAKASLAWLPGNSGHLLHQELYEALQKNGIQKIISDLPLLPDYQSLEKIWNKQIPQFILSINFRGLDSEGQIFEICQALNIPLAIWLVDNPWHLLSGIRFPWWKRAHIFVSDPDFVPYLRNCGARHVEHCPLAAASHMWREIPEEFDKKPLFVGRSTFPGQKEFFGNIKMDNAIVNEVNLYLTQNGHYPDYHWWQKKFQEKPWPGKGGRKAGFYADYFSAQNRARWLKAAAAENIRIIGDKGWKDLIPGCTVESQVDYYGALPNIYQKSPTILNVTSLLLPGSLNQRHFDVWAAGSMLLTEAGRGLDLFPSNLTSPIKLSMPDEFISKYDFWHKHPDLRKELISAWREHIIDRHSYAHRIEAMRNLVWRTGRA